jgi:RNA methyltransferase, TrmH family
MKVKDIASPKNSLLQKIRRLDNSSDRRELGLFLVEGRKLIGEALSKNVELVDVIVSKSFFDQEIDRLALDIDTVTIVQDKIFNTLCTTDSPCGILATAKAHKNTLSEVLKRENGIVVFGECIQDPGNLGTIIRTALAFEASGLILSRGSVDHLSPKVVRASMGAVFSLPILVEQEIENCLKQLKAHDSLIIALDAKASQTFDFVRREGRVVYLFGNEGQGLSAPALSLADCVVSIPINEASESLNVAVAMGIVLYHSKHCFESGGDRSR